MKITLIHFNSLNSTQTYAKENYTSFPANEITCVSADEQTAGYGRYQRKWISPKGANLYVTFCFRLPQTIQNLTSLALLMAYSFASLLIEKTLNPKIKWPNDVLLDDKKLSGILCETLFESTSVQLFLGIGINVNMETIALEQIDQPATSLKVVTGHLWNLPSLRDALQTRFANHLELFIQKGFAPFVQHIDQLLAYKGQKIYCWNGQKEWTGICHSLTCDGELKLLLPHGRIHILRSGETSLRPHL